MKTGSIFAAIAAVAAIGVGVYMVDINQTREGTLPEYDLNVGDVETGTEGVTVEVPTIDIESPEEQAADGS